MTLDDDLQQRIDQREQERAKWQERWHEAIVATGSPDAICELCGVRADRAIHDRRTAARHGVTW